jgi:hypothetical protein
MPEPSGLLLLVISSLLPQSLRTARLARRGISHVYLHPERRDPDDPAHVSSISFGQTTVWLSDNATFADLELTTASPR